MNIRQIELDDSYDWGKWPCRITVEQGDYKQNYYPSRLNPKPGNVETKEVLKLRPPEPWPDMIHVTNHGQTKTYAATGMPHKSTDTKVNVPNKSTNAPKSDRSTNISKSDKPTDMSNHVEHGKHRKQDTRGMLHELNRLKLENEQLRALYRQRIENEQLHKLCKQLIKYVNEDRCEGCACKSRCHDGMMAECWQLTDIRKLAAELGMAVN